jgi:GNAT superfamily N-acetyltransferase
MPDISIVPATEAVLPQVAALLHAQQVRQRLHDPRLPEAISQDSLRAALSSPLAWVALDEQACVRGYGRPGLWELKPTSILHAFLTARNGTVSPFVLPHPEEPDALTVVAALLEVLDTFWQQAGTSGDLLRWPSSDTWFAPLLTERGFQLDSICALRSLSPFFVMRPPAGPDQHVRLARPGDEAALLALFDEELRFHERYTPFVRSSMAVLEAFRSKLKRTWHGDTSQVVDAVEVVKAGAPLVLVVEQAGRVVAMAENTLLPVMPGDEPGYTPAGTYWCMDNVCVQEVFRGQGIGRLLMAAIEDLRQQLEIALDGYVLWYNPDNSRATRFWSGLGFEPLWTTYQRLH